MSGRGRGASNKAPIPGLSREEMLNQNILTPPELYPSIFFKPIKTEPEKIDLYLVKIKKRLRTDFKNSQFYLKEKKEIKTIDRYSDKYDAILNQSNNEINKVWNYDLFPDELKPKLKTKSSAEIKKVTFDDLKTKLDKLENAEADDENIEDEEKAENEEQEQEEAAHEEDIEEETDYALSYFDNGEEYLNESDDNLGDEATF